MADSKQVIDQLTREHAVSNRTSPTAAGPTDSEQPPTDSGERIDAINQVFALFRLNFGNQYYAAYPDNDTLDSAKRLWLESLAEYPPPQILAAARLVIDSSEYLPTVHRMLECCQQALSGVGLPDSKDAYHEACNARSPRSAQAWSHPAVYLAGRDTGWFLLSGSEEKTAWPVFRRHYQQWCARALAGESLEIPEVAALERQTTAPLSRKQQKQALEKLRRETGI